MNERCDTKHEEDVMTDSPTGSSASTPRWLKASGIVFAVLVVAFAGWHFLGGGLEGLHHAMGHVSPAHRPPSAHALPASHSADHPASAASGAPREVVGTPAPTPALESAAARAGSIQRAGAVPSIAGCWELAVEEHPLHGRFSFVVEGSSLSGTVTLHTQEHRIQEGTRNGPRFYFLIETSGTQAHFSGELGDSLLRGTMIRSGQQLSWTARRCATNP